MSLSSKWEQGSSYSHLEAIKRNPAPKRKGDRSDHHDPNAISSNIEERERHGHCDVRGRSCPPHQWRVRVSRPVGGDHVDGVAVGGDGMKPKKTRLDNALYFKSD